MIDLQMSMTAKLLSIRSRLKKPCLNALAISFTILLSGCVTAQEQLIKGFNEDKKLAEAGDATASMRLAYNSYYGFRYGDDKTGFRHYVSIKQDFKFARSEFLRCSKLGDKTCSAMAGMMLMSGEGGAKQETKAIALLKEGADKIIEANTVLGNAYLSGRGVKKDKLLALKYLSNASHYGDPLAMDRLADLYDEDKKTSKRSAALRNRANSIRLARRTKMEAIRAALKDSEKRQKELSSSVHKAQTRAQAIAFMASLGMAAIAAARASVPNPGPTQAYQPTVQDLINWGVIK
jgi:hypothetical protein